MKKLIPTIILAILFLQVTMAQKPKADERPEIPSFIKINEELSIEKEQDLFVRTFKMETGDELRLIHEFNDEIGMQHRKFQQYYNNILVDGATFTVHAQNQKIKNMSGNYRHVEELNTTPTIDTKTAFNAALKHVGASSYMWQEEHHHDHSHERDGYQKPEGELVIVATTREKKAPHLAYKFVIYATEPLSRAYVFIDAHTGAFIQEQNRLCNAYVPGTCATLYNGTKNITCENIGPYRLRTADVQTYDMNNGTNYGSATDVTSSSTNFGSGSAIANQAHFGAERTHNYFLTKHGRDSYNGAGAIIRSYVSYGYNYVNAFWDGSRMTYGDGNGVNYGPLVSLDIVGHEIAHGVTQYAAGLVYSYESGALNESFSDIFGEAVEHHGQGNNDWRMGDDIGIGGSGAFRNMANPNEFNHPDTYLGDYWYSGSGDNGGVHYNSGVQNFWFYLMTEGGSGTNDNGDAYNVTSIGMDKAAAIAYRNLAVYLSSNSQYADARDGAIQAAIDLYGDGSPEVQTTTDAWYAVGVGDPYGGCEPFLTINYPLSSSAEFEASDYINASSTVAPNINVAFDAGNKVRLQTGFHAKPNSNFHAFIDGCTTVLRTANETGKEVTQTTTSKRNQTTTGEVEPEIIQGKYGVKIYPNPFNDNIKIAISENTESDGAIALFDLNGKLLLEKSFGIGTASLSLNTAHLYQGMYVLKIRIGEEMISQKLVK